MFFGARNIYKKPINIIMDKEKKTVRFNNDVKIHYINNDKFNNKINNIYLIGISITILFIFIFTLLK